MRFSLAQVVFIAFVVFWYTFNITWWIFNPALYYGFFIFPLAFMVSLILSIILVGIWISECWND